MIVASFAALIERLMNEDAPGPLRLPDWFDAAIEQRPATILAPAEASEAVVSSYISDRESPRLDEKLTAEMMAARLLQISDNLSIKDLNRLRRTFSWLNHPDRRGANLSTQYTQLMVAANSLIDAEIAKRKASRATPAG